MMRHWAYALVLAGFLSTGLLTGCNLDQSATAKTLPYQTISYQKQGGKECKNNEWNTDETALCATLRVTYPQFDNSLPAAAAINKLISEEVLGYESDDGKQPQNAEELANFFINDYQQQPEQNSAWALERSMEVVFTTEQLLTLKFSEMGYSGGAHPNSGQTYFTLNTQTGKAVPLKELLIDNYETELNKIAEPLFRKDREIAANQTYEQAGFEFKDGQFALNGNYGVTAEGLVFYYNSYEIAPYVMGPTELTIPYSAIKSLLRPEGALASFKN